MYCDSCGKEISNEAVYCRFCGVKLNDSKVEKLENFGIDFGGVFFSLGDLGGTKEDRANHYFKIGVEASEKEEYNEAIEYFQKALEYNPLITNCYGNIACMHQKLKQSLLSDKR